MALCVSLCVTRLGRYTYLRMHPEVVEKVTDTDMSSLRLSIVGFASQRLDANESCPAEAKVHKRRFITASAKTQ